MVTQRLKPTGTTTMTSAAQFLTYQPHTEREGQRPRGGRIVDLAVMVEAWRSKNLKTPRVEEEE